VDSMNIMRNGGYGMRYEVIRRFVQANGDEVIRLNAYVAIDEERAVSDPAYKNTLNFILTLRDLGFKVVEKPIRWYTDESGRTYGKANLDMEMALDIISQSDRLDLIYLFTGDGDFSSVVTMVQNKGCRVELVAFANVSHRLPAAHCASPCRGPALGGAGQPGAGGVHQVFPGSLLRLFPLHPGLWQAVGHRHPAGRVPLYLGVFPGEGPAPRCPEPGLHPGVHPQRRGKGPGGFRHHSGVPILRGGPGAGQSPLSSNSPPRPLLRG